MLKEAVRRRVPRPLIEFIRSTTHRSVVGRTREILATAPQQPEWLATEELERLMRQYPVARPWSDDVIPATADHERAAIVLRHLGPTATNVLEIGGGPGYVAWAVQMAGRTVTSLDLCDPLHAGAAAAGVVGVNGDACALPFADSTFDACWSFNAFEHIQDPEAAVREAWRVTKPGGRIHLNFAPLYNAPLGLHAFFEVGVPFCQHLWSEEQLRTVVKSDHFWHLNYWSLRQYRDAWARLEPIARRTFYAEERDYTGLELIARYPSCFAKRSRDVDEFLVSKIVATFEVVKR